MNLDNLFDTINNLKKFDFEVEFQEQVVSKSPELLERIKDQLASGLNGDGSLASIDNRFEYRHWTKERKIKLTGTAGEIGFITNYMSGEFYDTLAVIEDEDGFYFTSSVPYFPEIVRRGNRTLLQINQENVSDVKEEIQDELSQQFENAFYGL